MPVQSPEAVMRQIGRRIAELRRANGQTQDDLAKKLRVSISWISRVERAGANLTVFSVVRIARAVGVEPKDLWEPATNAPKVRRGRPKPA